MIGVASNEMGDAARDAFAGLLDAHHTIARVRMLRDDALGYDPALWQTIAEQGWLGARVPDALGGVGLGATASAVIADLIGARLLPEPYLARGWLPARLLAGVAGGDVRTAALEKLLAGQVGIAAAWQEGIGQITASVGSTAVLRGKITGEKIFVAGGAGADAFIVTANAEGRQSVFLVDAQDPGVAVERVRQIDGSLSVNIRFQDAAAQMLAGEIDTFNAALDETRVALAVQLLAIARQALRITIDYAGTRRQFGKAIGSFQALQHRMVDYATRIRLGEVACDAALAAIDADAPDRATIARLAAAAKASAADTAVAVTQGAIQLHGAIGYTDEADIGLYLAAALRLSPWLGTSRDLRDHFLDLGGASGNA